MPSLNPAIPGLDVSEVSLDSLTQPFKRQTKPLPVPDVREIFPSGNRSAIPGLEVHDPSDLGRLRNFEQIDPKTLKPMMSGPGVSAVAAAPVAPQSPSGGWLRRTGQTLREANDYVNGTVNPGPSRPAPDVGKLRGAANAVSKAVAPALRVGGAAAAVVPGAVNTYEVARDKNSTGLDVATQAAEEVGKGATAWLGGQAGATAGAAMGAATGPFAPVAIPAGAILGGAAGGALGYFGGEKAIRSLRSMTGGAPDSPLEQARARNLPTDPTAAGIPTIRPFTPSTAGGGRGSINPALANPNDRVRDDPRAAGIHTDMTGALAPVPRDLPSGLNDGRVYKTRDAAGNVTYSGRNVEEGAKIADGRGALIGQLDSGNAPGPVASGGMYDRELTSLRDLGAARAAADPGWGGGATGMGPSLRDIERKNAETTASSIDRRTAARGERQIGSMDKQDITNTQAGAHRYAADAGLRGSMYAADRRLQGDLAQSQANTLRTQMEMQFKTGNRALMAQIYQWAGGKADVAAKLAAASGLDPTEFLQMHASEQGAEAKNQDIQGKASDRVREDLKQYVRDENGKMVEDPAASQETLDVMRQLFPGITGTDPAYYEANAPKIKAMAGILNAARANKGVGILDYTPFGNDPQKLTKMPDWKGATISKADGWEDFTTGRLDKGEHVLTTKDGKKINLGALDDTQVDLILKHAKTGNWE